MKRQILTALNGANPLGFLAAIGLLRIARRSCPRSRLGFATDGSFRAFLDDFDDDPIDLVIRDASDSPSASAPWWITYGKEEKNGIKPVADLKAPPSVFAKFLGSTVKLWVKGEGEGVSYGAAFGTSTAVDGKGSTKPTAFHFTAANQKFLEQVERIRLLITSEWVSQSLFEGHANRSGGNLRWDPGAEQNWALMANNPIDGGTTVDAPAEWLAFRALPFFPTVPAGSRIMTTAVSGRGEEMQFVWPLWSVPASPNTARSLLALSIDKARVRKMRGVFALCSSSIRRTSQGFGNFGPADVTT